jgi:FMN phosphatase YigB (HAD superfamily)
MNEIKKISIFDFDGTLVDSPKPKDGMPMWEEVNGYEYPFKTWWDRVESLDQEVFDIDTIESTIDDYNEEYENEDTLVIMLTGRLSKFRDTVKKILYSKGLVFDEYHFKDIDNTLLSKVNKIEELLHRYPNVEEIEMWEDRKHHAKAFEIWGETNGIPINVNLVTV